MLTGIDHFIVAVRDPDDAATELERVLGLRAGGGGRHEAHGTHNRLIWLGDSYIELMGVFDRTLAADSWFGSHALAVVEQGTESAMYVMDLRASKKPDVTAPLVRLLGGAARRTALLALLALLTLVYPLIRHALYRRRVRSRAVARS